LIGVGFSWMLWKQQRLSVEVTKRDQQSAVQAAVRQSNDHSDEQIAGVRKDVHTETQTLDEKMKGLSSQVAATETHINGAIHNVVVPSPQYAKLQFSLFPDSTVSLPLTTESLAPDKDGVFTVDFTVTNISETTAARGADLWVFVCTQCKIVEEPQGFDRPNGLPESERHKVFQNLNPGVSLEKMTVKLKLVEPYQAFLISFKYSCETCGKMTAAQDLKVLTTPYIASPTATL